MVTEDSDKWQLAARLLTVLTSVFLTVAVSLMFWLFGMIQDLDARMNALNTRVVAIESNRFTSADAIALMKDFNAAISAINIRLAELPYISQKVADIQKQITRDVDIHSN